MSSLEKINPGEQDDESINIYEKNKPSKRSYLIWFIVFFILGILLLVFILWWFIWRNPNNPLKRVCSSSNHCLPGEICNTDTSLCNVVPCTLNSQCGTALGANASCVRGYCQISTCSNNTDCTNIGPDFVCTNVTSDVATPWITTACVKTGTSCVDKTDCYGGNAGLICSNQLCVQCAGDTDCSGGLVCSSGVCQECSSASPCTTGACGNGTCCSAPPYTVNGVLSCTKGELFDLCTVDTDCKTNKCLDLGSGTKICGGGTNGTMTFSAGTKVTAGNPATVATFTCPFPGSPVDKLSAPFAVNGSCVTYSTSGLNSGSACGKSSFCINPSKSANLVCAGNVTFTNPFAQACKQSSDCTQANYACSNSNICGPTCTGTVDCPSGFVCLNSSGSPPIGGTSGVCQYPIDQISCTSTNCPKNYSCDTNSSVCVWSGGLLDGGTVENPNQPPPPFVIESICSRPSTALNVIKGVGINSIPAYCTNGTCSTTPGWINTVCVVDGDCMFLGNDPNSGERLSLNCESQPFGLVNLKVCK